VTSPGELLIDRYRLVGQLGGGSMGSVWEAYDEVLERTVAVKELLADHSSGEPMAVRLERVRREALALAKVEHPAVVTLHDLIFARSPQDPWIVMGYAHGRSLDKIIAADGPLAPQQVATIGLAVAEGLLACHQLSVYHRDVKPANVVVGDYASVRLVDFGIARIVGQASLTAPRNVIGTPEYLAPELLEKRPGAVGPSADLWALAVTLYYSLTGQSPFRAETFAATFAAILSRNPPVPRGGGPLADLVLRMLRKRPADRPDAAAVLADLRDVVRREDHGSRPGGPGLDRTAGLREGTGYPPRLPAPRYPSAAPPARRRPGQPARPGPRPSLFSGVPVSSAAKTVAKLPTEQGVGQLLAVDTAEAAGIINCCDDADGGRLLSGIAAVGPARGRGILEMVNKDRAGLLLDHMSSVAAAGVLAVQPATGAVRIMDQSDKLTVVGALSEMDPDSAARIVLAMDEGRAVEVLRQAAPVKVAPILRRVSSAARRQALLSRLPEPFRVVVARLL
jgi:hypothetical protein